MSDSARGVDRRIGMVIGDYTITQKLAEGGMGAVYLAENLPTGLKQIVKFMLAEFVANPALRERFEREIRASVRLKGKTNIVEIYSCNERDGELYMTMEYLQGETLQDHVRRCGQISLHHAFRLIAQIIAALHELHEAGIIHRDLKPANVFVVPTDAEAYTVKLIDFGIIHDRHAIGAGAPKTQSGSLVGTPGYMALEQFGDAGNVTPAADVFALAVVIWEMFTGELPWSAPNEFAQYEKQKSEAPVLPPGHHLPSSWEPIIRAALSPNPNQRPQLHALLYALARDVPAEPPIPGGFDMVVRYAPRVLRKTPVEVETIRASEGHHAAAAYWGIHRSTVAPQDRPSAPVWGADAIPTSALGTAGSHASPTVSARPGGAAPEAPLGTAKTTLSSAVGSSVMGGRPGPGRVRNRIAIAVTAIAAVAVLAFGIAMGVSSRSASSAPSGRSMPRDPDEANPREPDEGILRGGDNMPPVPAVVDAAPIDALIEPVVVAPTVDAAVPTDAAIAAPTATPTPKTKKPTNRTKRTSAGSGAAPHQPPPTDDPDAPAE